MHSPTVEWWTCVWGKSRDVYKALISKLRFLYEKRLVKVCENSLKKVVHLYKEMNSEKWWDPGTFGKKKAFLMLIRNDAAKAEVLLG